MDCLKALTARRSIRRYLEKPISDEDLKEITSLGTVAPTGMNKKELYFLGLKQEETTKLRTFFKELAGTDYYYEAPHIIIVFAKKKELKMADLDVGAAIENIYLAATAKGYGACWIHAGRFLFNVDAVKNYQKEVLGIDPEEYLGIETVVVGYPGEIKEENKVDEKRFSIK